MTRTLFQDHGIGVASGTKFLYTSADFARAADLLRLNKIDPSTSPDAWATGGRTDAGAFRGNEKWAGMAASAGLIAVACLPGRLLCVAKVSLSLPENSHLVLPVEDIAGDCLHDALIVVENFESFRRCGRWNPRYTARCGANPLVVFRGEKEGTRADAVNALLRRSSLPVFAAFDLDPAGLGSALTLPRLDGLVAPSALDLERHLRVDRKASSGRADLFQKQYAQWAPSLDRTSNEAVLALWEIVRRYGEGLVQEAFLERDMS